MAARRNTPFDQRALIRLTTWGTTAAVALTLAVLSSVSTTGQQRAKVAVAAWSGDAEPRQITAAQLIPRPGDAESERRRLNEAIRLLAADRDRLLTRIGSIERNLDDMTGSINRQAAASQPLPQISSLQPDTPAVTPRPPAPASPPTAAAAPPAPASLPTAAAALAAPEWLANAPEPWPSPSAAIEIAPAPQAQTRVATVPAAAAGDTPPAATAAPAATRTEFGVDIGGASSLDELRALWNAAKGQHPRLLGGLRPIFSVREDRSGTLDMRLIVGPLANASAAARLCASLGAADVMCSTRPYDGQRLAVR